jgi:hypothetical protein
MRIPVLLSVLAIAALILFLPTVSAQTPTSAGQTAALGLNDPGVILHVNGDGADGDANLYGDVDKLGRRNFCLKMRTYVVARDRSHPDTTHLVGYTDCQPASRYDLRSTSKPQAFDGSRP